MLSKRSKLVRGGVINPLGTQATARHDDERQVRVKALGPFGGTLLGGAIRGKLGTNRDTNIGAFVGWVVVVLKRCAGCDGSGMWGQQPVGQAWVGIAIVDNHRDTQ